MIDPFAQLRGWLAEATATEPNDPDAMALATVGADGQPSVRMVLLKDVEPDALVFYTNGESRKAGELAANGKAAICLHWKSLRRQVRAEGTVAATDAATADAYFASRGRASRLGAWASDQSRPLPDRATLEARLREVEARFEGQDVPRPPHWGGWRLRPDRIEFWEDGAHRLHNRELFERHGDGWRSGLLFP